MSYFKHTQADIIAKKNKTVWTPETGFTDDAIPLDTPWRVTGDTMDNSVRLVFNLKNRASKNNCPNSDSGLIVIIY